MVSPIWYTIGYILSGCVTLGIGLWLSITSIHIYNLDTQFHSLPFGCYVATFWLWMLSGKGVVKAYRRYKVSHPGNHGCLVFGCNSKPVGNNSPIFSRADHQSTTDSFSSLRQISNPHALEIETLLQQLLVSSITSVSSSSLISSPLLFIQYIMEQGLSTQDIVIRQRFYEPNIFWTPVLGSPLWYALLDEIHEPQQKLLLVVAVLYTLVGEIEEGALALGVIFLMVCAEVITEWRAKRALASLAVSTPSFAYVVRNNQTVRIPQSEIVPGDIILLKAGYEVPADARILSSSTLLQSSEANLTGESLPITKATNNASLPIGTPLSERSNMVYAGSTITEGQGLAIVTNTGSSTEIGKVYTTTQKQLGKEKRTPLQTLLRSVAGKLTYIALFFSILGALLGLIRSMPWQDIVLIALSLAFATIPEELPILIAAVLAIGAQTLSRNFIFVKRLRAMEALSYVNIILTDKTGTLTWNRLSITNSVSFGYKNNDAKRKKNVVLNMVTESTTGTATLSLLPYQLSAWICMRQFVGLHDVSHIEANKSRSVSSSSSSSTTTMVHSDLPHNPNPTQEFMDPFERAIDNRLKESTWIKNKRIARTDLHILHDFPFDPVRKMAGRVIDLQDYQKDKSSMIDDLSQLCEAYRQIYPNHDPWNGSNLGKCLLIKGTIDSVLPTCRYLVVHSTTESMQDDERIEELTNEDKDGLIRTIDECSQKGLRIVSLALHIMPDSKSNVPNGPIPSSLDSLLSSVPTPSTGIFLGAFCFQDTLRQEVPATIQLAQKAGIKVMMVTGDHPLAATEIAKQANILHKDYHYKADNGFSSVIHCATIEMIASTDIATLPSSTREKLTDTAIVIPSFSSSSVTEASASSSSSSSNNVPLWCNEVARRVCYDDEPIRVFSRATPQHKLQLVHAFQEIQKNMNIIAVTGDGINDAPALAVADIGIVMNNATDVARNAASIVVLGTNFSSLLQCIKEGRRLYDNLVNALAFYLGAKVGLVILFIIGTLWYEFPFTAVQVIILELFMDLGASTSFVAEPAVATIMERPPLSLQQPFFHRGMIMRILGGGFAMIVAVLSGMAYAIYDTDTVLSIDDRVRGITFIIWLMAHVCLAYNQRSGWDEPLGISTSVSINRVFFVWILGVIIFCLIVSFVPGGITAINVPNLPVRDWSVAIGICIGSTFWLELIKWFIWLRRRS